MKDVYIVGEDPVTKAIIRRLVKDYAPSLNIVGDIPARGGQIKSKIENFNTLSRKYPVILLLDLDANDCAPQLKQQLLKNIQPTSDFIVNIAIEEAESWLFADKENFASYLRVDRNLLPNGMDLRMNGPRVVHEVYTTQKPSRVLTHEIALKSTDALIRRQVGVDDVNEKCKGNEYNCVIEPFICDVWKPEIARASSNSLSRMISRLQSLNSRYSESPQTEESA